ncbi:MAG: hypothetical protein ISS01_02130 [Nanoarchaeota archaeon]|nr:hypothetical protein [Nanoarchaeota archaeon]
MAFRLEGMELGSVSKRIQVHYLMENHPEVYQTYLEQGGQTLEELYKVNLISHNDFSEMANFVMQHTGASHDDFLHIGSYIGKDKHDQAAIASRIFQSPYFIFDQSETGMNPKLNIDSRIIVNHLDDGEARILHYNIGLASNKYLLAPLTSVGYYHGVGVVCNTDIFSNIRMLDQKLENVFRELGIDFERRGDDFYRTGSDELLATRVGIDETALSYLEIQHPMFRVIRDIELEETKDRQRLIIPEGEFIQGNPNRFNQRQLPINALEPLTKRDLSYVVLTKDLSVFREGTVFGLDTPSFTSVYDFTWEEPSAARKWWRQAVIKTVGFFGANKKSLDVVSEGFRESELGKEAAEQAFKTKTLEAANTIRQMDAIEKELHARFHHSANYFGIELVAQGYSLALPILGLIHNLTESTIDVYNQDHTDTIDLDLSRLFGRAPSYEDLRKGFNPGAKKPKVRRRRRGGPPSYSYLDVQEGISFLNNEVVALPFLNDETKAILSDFQSGLNLLLETCKNYDKIMRRWMKEYATESWAEFSLRDLVLDELRTNFPGQASQINLELALSPGLTMRGHKENIGLLFANLLGNGLKATMAYDSPKIYVQAEQIEEGFKVILGNSCELPPQSVIDDLNSDAETERGGKIVIRRVVSDHGGSINYVPNGENNLEAILNFPEKTLVKF